jgi:hypothetical protein
VNHAVVRKLCAVEDVDGDQNFACKVTAAGLPEAHS